MDGLKTNSDWQTVVAGLNRLLEERDLEVEALLESQETDGLRRRINKLRAKLTEKVGLDFERCPLDAEVVGTIQMEGYKIEKVKIQSLPGYYVPVNVYLPVGKGRFPAVLVSMGHYIEGKHIGENQIMCANLALRGFIAATYDPICQGERDMYPERTGQWYKNDIWMVEEHMRVGHQSYALGESSARYFVWDGMRVLDYICGRPDVDPEKVGCTGQSGGGTATYYLAALDDRVKVAAPIQCLTRQRMTFKSNGIGDPEQTIFALWEDFAFDHPDFLWLAFPKPVLIVAGLRDYFFIDGVREIAREVSSLYRQLGDKEAFKLAEVDSEHYISREVRLNCYNWFERWLKGGEGDCNEADVTVLPEQELYCLGNVKDNKTAMYMNRRRLQNVRNTWKKPGDAAALAKDIKNIIKVKEGPYQVVSSAKVDFIEFHIKPESGYTARSKLYKGVKDKPLLAFIDFNLRFDEADILKIFKGYNILFVKPFAMEATLAKKEFCYDLETALSYSNFFTGGSLFACRVETVLYSLKEALRLTGNLNIAAVGGSGQGAHIAMAAALYDERIQNVLAFEGIGSFDSIFDGTDFFIAESSIIPGMAGRYDTVDMMVSLGERMAAFINPMDNFQQQTSAESLKKEYSALAAIYGGCCTVKNVPVEAYIDNINSILGKVACNCAPEVDNE